MIYASLLSPEAQAVIGKVGAQTRGVEKMLRRIAFRCAKRIDPFDGGPHFVATADEVEPIRDTVKGTIQIAGAPPSAQRAIVARDLGEPPYFRAVVAPAVVGDASVELSAEACVALGVSAGDPVSALRIPRSGRTGA